MLGGFNEMLPPGGSDIFQLWSAAPLLAAVIEGLAGIRSNAAAHRVELCPQVPAALEVFSLEGLKIGEHQLSLNSRRAKQERRMNVVHESGSVPLDCVFRAVVKREEVVLLNDREIPVRPRASSCPGHDEVVLEFMLKPRERAHISVVLKK
jgi:hypothetical protein